MTAREKNSKKKIVKKVTKPKKKAAVVKAKPKKRVATVQPQWIISMIHKAIEGKSTAEFLPVTPQAELPPPIPQVVLPPAPPETFFNIPPCSVDSFKEQFNQLSLPLVLPVEVAPPPVEIQEPLPQITPPPVRRLPARPLPAKKVFTNIDLVKSGVDKALGCFIKTIVGGLVLGGFIGLLQFCTKISETGMPLKNVVIFTISSYLAGLLLD